MGVTSEGLEQLNIVDETVPEPMGGAHRDIEEMSTTLRQHLSSQLDVLLGQPLDQLLEKRFERLMSYGSPI
jgi:acetyl-CoA carboxylase carboxyl transferase subunit alpha